VKINFDHLEMIYKASSDFDSIKPTNCENSSVVLQKKVNYLITTASKLSPGTTNLNAILGLKILYLKRLPLGINVVFNESKRNLVVSLKLMSSSFQLS